MSERRQFFFKTILRWWAMVADDRDWSTPDTPGMLAAESRLWEMKEKYEAGEIKLSAVKPVFDAWVKAHQKAKAEIDAPLDAMRTNRKQEARA